MRKLTLFQAARREVRDHLAEKSRQLSRNSCRHMAAIEPLEHRVLFSAVQMGPNDLIGTVGGLLGTNPVTTPTTPPTKRTPANPPHIKQPANPTPPNDRVGTGTDLISTIFGLLPPGTSVGTITAPMPTTPVTTTTTTTTTTTPTPVTTKSTVTTGVDSSTTTLTALTLDVGNVAVTLHHSASGPTTMTLAGIDASKGASPSTLMTQLLASVKSLAKPVNATTSQLVITTGNTSITVLIQNVTPAGSKSAQYKVSVSSKSFPTPVTPFVVSV